MFELIIAVRSRQGLKKKKRVSEHLASRCVNALSKHVKTPQAIPGAILQRLTIRRTHVVTQ